VTTNTLGCGQPSATVLLVHPDRATRTILRACLADSGCLVLEADCGEAAKRTAERAVSVDLLLTDVMMPRVSGPELARYLKFRFADLRVLYMSDHSLDRLLSQPHILEQSFGFVQEPFAPDALADWVRVITDGAAIAVPAGCEHV